MNASTPRRDFYDRLESHNAGPLWDSLADLIRTEPSTARVPELWRYEEIRPLLMEAGDLITAKEAERRVLMLKNPGLGGAAQITHSLYAGLQLVMPGETARSHRHVASASRFVIESSGGYTAV